MPEFVSPDLWIKGGLLSPEHRKRMGEAVWLYLYLQAIIRFDGPDAGSTTADRPYRHTEAADALGVDVRSIKREFVKLERHGYLTARRVNHGLMVTVTKYIPPSVRARSRRLPKDGNAPRLPESQVTFASEPSDVDVQAKGRLRSSQVTFASPSNKEDKRTSDTSVQTPVVPDWRASLVEAFTARGLKAPNLDGNEGINAHKLLRENTPDSLAQCWQDIQTGEYGDDAGWLLRNLSFVTLNERNRFNNWLLDKVGATKRPQRKGPESSTAKMLRAAQAFPGRSQRALTGA